MRKVTKGRSMLALAAVLAVGACSGGSNRDSVAAATAADSGAAMTPSGTGAMSGGTTGMTAADSIRADSMRADSIARAGTTPRP